MDKQEEMKDDNLEQEVTTEEVQETEAQTAPENDVEEETGAEEVDELSVTKARIEGLEKELEESKAQYLRKHADFENFRKRMIKEKSDAIKHANESLITDLIEIIDNFDRALASANESTEFESFKTGIEMIEKQFKGMLSTKWGLSRIEALGQEFDPQIHEAMFMEDSEEVEVPTVAEEFQSGYKLHDKVLRAPKVKVSKPKA